MRQLFLAGAVLLVSGAAAWAQNLVPNPSFEDYKSLPSDEADFHLVREWFSPSTLSGNKASYPTATVDYLHKRGSSEAKLPASYYGTVEPYDGEAVAHFTVTNGATQNFREYLGVRLLSAPEVGKRYEVSFYLSNGTANHYGKRAAKDVHVLFTNEIPRQSTAETLESYEPQLKMDKMLFTTGWEKITFEYIPDKPGQDVMVIGNFYPPSKTILGNAFDGRYDQADFFIDMVSVVKLPESGIASKTPVPARVEAPPVEVQLIVLDQKTSRPLGGAEIVLTLPEVADLRYTTNADGRILAKLSKGAAYDTDIRKAGYQPKSEALSLTEGKKEYIFYLEKTPPKGVAVQVQVFEQNSGMPIQSATLMLKPFVAERVRTVYTSAKGFVGIGLPMWESFEVTVSKEGYTAFSTLAKPVEKTASGASPDSLYYELSVRLTKKEVMVYIAGNLLEAGSKKPLSGEVALVLGTKTEKITVGADGKFLQTVPYLAGVHYAGKAKGYMGSEGDRNINPSTTDIYLTLNIELEKVEVGKTITLKNVLFELSKATLLAESYPELDKLLALMVENPGMEIRMDGHTDYIGDPKKNQALSEERVEAIKAYLVSKGIDTGRITGKGYGGSKALYHGNDPEQRKLNRRVEFTVTKMP